MTEHTPKDYLEDFKERTQAALDTPEVKAAVTQSKSFYAENKKLINGVVIGLALYKLHKRSVAKAIQKAYDNDMPDIIDKVVEVVGPTMFDVLSELYRTPDKMVVPDAGGMAHLLTAKNVVLTVFGDFRDMDHEQVKNFASKALWGL